VYYIQRNGIKIPFFDLGWRFALAAALMGAVASLLLPKVSLFIVVFLAALLYAGLVLLFRGFSQQDWELFSQVWRQQLRKKTFNSEVVAISAKE